MEPQWKQSKLVNILLLFYAIGGGFFACLGAFIEESLRIIPLVPFLVAPLIEEILKPIGVILVLEDKPSWIKNKWQIFWLCIVGALVFSFLENLLYIYVYTKNTNTVNFIIFRYIVCTSVHLISTGILAWGLMREYVNMTDKGRKFEVENLLTYITTAVIIHGGYNFLAYILSSKKAIIF